MTLPQQHLEAITDNHYHYQETNDECAKSAKKLFDTEVRAAATACSEVSKEYAKGFGEWIAENGYGFSHVTKAWHIPEAKTTDQLLSLYEEHLEKEKIK